MLVALLLVTACFQSQAIDPECYMTVPEIARHFGYVSEVHLVRTPDDYILELHRIPHGKHDDPSKERPVVFLQHGVFADGFTWTPNLPTESAAFVFADAGFDVWIANDRGTPPSQKHVGFGPDDQRFWNFTWEEISIGDLTSAIDLVLNKTKQKNLYYVGHSQGTMLMFAKLAEHPDFASKIRQFHALAPVATVSHIGGLFRLFGYRLMDLAQVRQLSHLKGIGPLDLQHKTDKFLLHRIPYSPLALPKFLQRIISFFCSLPIARGVCTLDIGFIDGREKMFNKTRVGTYLCHIPAATSSKNLLHWVQVVKAKKLQKFDYGKAGNLIQYGQKHPPVYDLSKIDAPTYIYWSKDDILADTEDIRETILAEMNATIFGNYELPHYTHLDFVFALNATNDVYRPIVAEIQKSFYPSRFLRSNRVQL